MSHNTSDSAVCSAIQQICERINSTRSRGLSDAISHETYPTELDLDFSTNSVTEFAENYMLTKVLSKYKGWKPTKGSAKQNAINGWYAVETENEKTNKRLRDFQRGTGFPGSDLVTIISMAQSHISEILGRFDVRKVLRSCRWGPGATADHPRGTCRDQKMTQRMSTTESALPYMKILIEGDPNWMEAVTGIYPDGPFSLVKDFWKVISHSRFATVPKKWDIDRIIDIQPTANGYLQVGTGQFMRSRLHLFGIDLNSQEYNQNAARQGVRKGLATVDLQNASDSIALELCTLLLPWDWMQWLTKLRTTSTMGFGLKEPKKLQKISSMGNGFTFELETIVFYAITKAVCEFEQLSWEEVLVYGDDIVCPNQAFERLRYVFEYFGFTINSSKSYWDGEFRESCGRHFFRDVEVTPIYQKNLVNSAEEVIRFHNRIVRWSRRTYGDPWHFEEALTTLVDYYCFLQERPPKVEKIPRVPLDHVSDEGFLCPSSEFEIDINGGCFTTVYRRCQQRKKGRRIEEAYYALKLAPGGCRHEGTTRFLRKSVFYHLDNAAFNADPRGYVFEDTGRGRYRAKRTYIFRAT